MYYIVYFTLIEQKMRRLELMICNSYHVGIQDLIDCSSRKSFHHFVESSMSNYGHGKDEKFCDGKNCSLLKSKTVLIQLQVFIWPCHIHGHKVNICRIIHHDFHPYSSHWIRDCINLSQVQITKVVYVCMRLFE